MSTTPNNNYVNRKKHDDNPKAYNIIKSASTLQCDNHQKQTDEGTHPWDSFKPSACFSCVKLPLQLVLLGGFGSFLFGFSISSLNTSLNTINSVFLQCGGDGDLWVRYNEMAVDVCSRYPDCKAGCDLSNPPNVVCPGGYNRKYGWMSPETCDTIEECKSVCGVMEKGTFKVRCPGGFNEVGTIPGRCDLKWRNSFVKSSVLIGATLGSLIGSRFLAKGRRTVLLVTMWIFLIGTVCSAVANSYSALVWGRLIVGLAVGLVSVASPTYMSEVTPKELRGSYGVVHQLMIVVGLFVPNLLGLALQDPAEQNDFWVPSLFQQFWWRFMVALAFLPALLVLYLLGFVYTFDTPVYYVEQGKFKDAARLLALIHGKDDIKEELDNVVENVRQGEINKEQGLSFTGALRYTEYRHVIIVGILLSSFQQFGGINVFMTSSNAIFNKAGLSGNMQTVMSMTMSLINIVMTFPTLYLIERMGRRFLMLMGSAGQLLSVLPAAIMYWIDQERPLTQILAIVAVLGFVTFFALAYGPVLWVYLFEIYPLEIKDVAAGVATASNWVSGVVMVVVANVLPNQISYTLFAGLQFLATLLIFFLMKETRGLPLGQSPFISKKPVV